MPSVVPGPFDRVRPLDGAGRTVLAYFSGTGVAAVVKAIGSDDDRQAAGLWSTLDPHPSLVSAAGLLAGGEGVVYDYVAPDAYSRKAQVRSAFERRLRRDPVAFPEVLRLGVLACRGLEDAYAGGVHGHGNLKPSNLLLGLDGGLRVSEPGLPGTESPLHMAPERFEGALADERSDAYSLGVILYQMAASGRPPFEAPAPGVGPESDARFRDELHRLHKDALVPRLDSPLAALLERCLAKAPGSRLGLAALRTELEDLLRRETGLLPALPGSAEAAGWERAQQALALLATGRADPALLAFEEALKTLPPSAAVRAARATALHVAGRPEDAVASADEALAVDPQNAAAWQQKGVSLAALGRSDEAASALEQATFLAPRDAAPCVALAVLLGRLGRLPQSLAAYDRAVAADPDHLDVWLERGKTLAEAGLRADAAGALLRFLDLTPAHHPARPRAEELLREVREVGGAVVAPPEPVTGPEPAAPKAPATVPEPVDPPEPVFVPEPEPPVVYTPTFETAETAVAAAPLEALAPPADEAPRALLPFDDTPTAEEPLPEPAPDPEPPPAPSAGPERPVVAVAPEPEIEPGDAAGWSARGVSLFRAGRLDAAIDAFDRAIAADGRNASHWANRASVLFRLARTEEGLAGHARALSLEPRLASSWLNKAAIEKALGRHAEAARSLLELLALDPPPEVRLVDQGRSLLAEIEGQGVLPAPRGALGFLREGLQEAEAGRLAEAAAAFESALSHDPLLPGAGLLRGDALAQLGRAAEASEAYEKGLAADPDDPRLLLSYARSRARLGDLDMAAAILSRCLEVATGDARSAAERLLSAVEARRRPAPLEPPPPSPEIPPPSPVVPEPADELPLPQPQPPTGPPSPEPRPPTGLGEAGRGSEPSEVHEAALPAPREAPTPQPLVTPPPTLEIATAPEAPREESAATWAQMGHAALGTGRFEDALSSFMRAAELDAANADSLLGQAESLAGLDRFDEALPGYDAALQVDPQRREAWMGRGLALKRLARHEEAVTSFVKALQLDPADAEALHQKAGSEELAGRTEEAFRSYEQLLAVVGARDARRENAEARLVALREAAAKPAPPAPPPPPPADGDPIGRATALLSQARPAEAFEVMEQALAAGMDDARVWLARGDALRALGRKEEAAASFDQALKRAPHDPQAWIKKGEALDAAGVYAEAAVCYDKAVELHPRHIGAWNSKGVALTRLGRMEEALACFTRALELDPRFALARFNRGAAEDVLGRTEEAVGSFEAFLSLATPNQRVQIQHAQKRLLTLKAPRT